MNKNNKLIAGIVIIVLVIAAFAFFNKEETTSVKPVVKIGVTLPLTGNVAMLGEDSQKALLLAQEQLSTDTKYSYEFVFEDDQFKPQLGATITNKFIDIDSVSTVFSFGSPVGNAVSPITEKAKVPHINSFASDTNVANGEYNFLHYTPPYKDAAVFINALNERDLKTVVFFGQQDNPGARAIINAFEDAVVGTDIKVLSNQKFNTGTRDFRTLITSVKNLNPDIYVLEATSPELETLTKQIREAGIQTPVTTMEAFEFSDQLSLFEGMWYVNAADPKQWFIDLFTEKYGSLPKFGSGNMYDSFNLLVAVIEDIGDGKTPPSREEIKEALTKVKSFDGALGDNLSIDENGLVVSEAVVRIIKDGKPVTISE